MKGHGDLPEWANNPQHFWQSCDKHERANARLFYEHEFALPVELNEAQQKQAVERYIEMSIPGQPHTWAIHSGKGTNPHCHLVFSERKNDGIKRNEETFFKRANKKNPEKGGACKKRFLKSKDFLISSRRNWEVIANDELQKIGSKSRVSHKTLEAQHEEGLIKKAREPQLHLGVKRIERIERKIKEKLSDVDNEKWSGEDVLRITRNLAGIEARGRKNLNRITQSTKKFDRGLREREKVPGRNIEGIQGLHRSCSEAFVYAQNRGQRNELSLKHGSANERNRRADERNRGEVQRDQERGRILRERQHFRFLDKINRIFGARLGYVRSKIRNFGEKVINYAHRLDQIALSKIRLNQPEKKQERSRGVDFGR